MLKQLIAGVVLTTGLCGAANAATTHILTATYAGGNPEFSDFTISFMDTGDGLFDFGELVSFSGVTLQPSGINSFFDTIVEVPAIANISNLHDPLAGVSGPSNWYFTRSGGTMNTHFSNWTYTVAAVPEIDAAAGMGSLAALGAMMAFYRGRRTAGIAA